MAIIKSKQELKFYIMADHMMNRGTFKREFLRRIVEIFFTDQIMAFLRSMRRYSYYKNQQGRFAKLLSVYYYLRFRKWSHSLGFTIECDTLGYGVVIPHQGTIVVGKNLIGNYAVLQTSICISSNDKIIGDALYVGTGAKITSKIVLGDNVSIGANSVVNKSFPDGNCMIAGAPAVIKKVESPWYIRDGQHYTSLVEKIEKQKKEMGV